MIQDVAARRGTRALAHKTLARALLARGAVDEALVEAQSAVDQYAALRSPGLAGAEATLTEVRAALAPGGP